MWQYDHNKDGNGSLQGLSMENKQQSSVGNPSILDESTHLLQVEDSDSEIEDADESNSTNSVLLELPSNVIVKIFPHLSNMDLVRLSMTCTHMYELIWNKELWDDRLLNYTYIQDDYVKDRFVYNYRLKDYKSEIIRLLKLDLELRGENHAYISVIKRIHRVRYFDWIIRYGFLHRPMDFLLLILLFIGTFLIAFKLHGSIGFPWRVVLLPYLIPIVIITISHLLLDLARCQNKHYHPTFDRLPFVYYFVLPTGLLKRMTSACLLLSFTFLLIKANERMDGIHVAAVFAPLILLLLFYILAIFSVYRTETTLYDKVTFFTIIVPLTVQFFILTFRIEHHTTWRWSLTFLPSWILFVTLFVYPFITACVRNMNHDRVQGLFDLKLSAFSPIANIYWVLIAPCCIAFLAQLAMHLDVEIVRSWLIIFAPLFVMHVLILLLCGLVEVFIAMQDCCEEWSPD